MSQQSDDLKRLAEARGDGKKKFTGTIYYASKQAKQDRYYKEGHRVTIDNYQSYHMIEPSFVQIEFNSSGTSYVHMAIKSEEME